MDIDYKKGLISFKEGRFQDAIDIFSEIVKKNRDNASAWHALGASYLKINKVPEAFNCILISTRIEPDNQKFQKSLSIITKKLEKFTKTSEYQVNYVDQKKKERINSIESSIRGIVYIIAFIFSIYLIITVSIPSFFILIGQDTPTSQFDKLSIDQIIAKSKSIPYETLLRNPDKYKGYLVRIDGQVLQIIPSNQNNGDILIATKPLVDGNTFRKKIFSDDIVYVRYRGQNDNKILENDIVTIYGEYNGRLTYQTYLGSKTVPEIIAVFLEINNYSNANNFDLYQNTQQELIDDYSTESINNNFNYHPSLRDDQISELKSQLSKHTDNFLPITRVYGDWINNQIENIFFELEVPSNKNIQNIEGIKVVITINNQDPIELYPTYDRNIINPGEKQKISINLQGNSPKVHSIFLFAVKTKDDLPLWFGGEIVPEYAGGVINNFFDFQ